MSRQSKSGTPKKREKKSHRKHDASSAQSVDFSDDSPMESGSFLQEIRGGMRSAFGTEVEPAKKSWSDYIWTALLLIALAGMILWKFGGK